MTFKKRLIGCWPRNVLKKRWFVLFVLASLSMFTVTFVTSEANFLDWFIPWQNFVFLVEESLQQWLKHQAAENPLFLMPIAFSGGLIASLSPCSLGMLSVNLSYIGTRQITSRQQALKKAGLFVLGVMTTLSLLGLFSSLAGVVLVQYKGYVNVIMGTIIGLMGLALLKLFQLPLPQTQLNLPVSGPYTFGLTFALVSSPCTSPVLLAILTTATATSSFIFSLLLMVSYTCGYTALLFLCSVFTGLMKQTRGLLPYSEVILKIGGFILLLVGFYYLINGSRWFLLLAQ